MNPVSGQSISVASRCGFVWPR